jgi:hypothetical protein
MTNRELILVAMIVVLAFMAATATVWIAAQCACCMWVVSKPLRTQRR